MGNEFNAVSRPVLSTLADFSRKRAGRQDMLKRSQSNLRSAALIVCCLGGVVLNSFAAIADDEDNSVRPPLEQRYANDPEIDESSGLARSNVTADRFWTHNDSGDSPRLFAIDGENAVARALNLDGIRAIDWEDVTSGRLASRNWIIIGDVGDNGRKRDSVFLYAFEEPLAETQKWEIASAEIRKIEMTYPDGAGDCEAIALDEENERLLLIKKTLLPLAGVYSVALDKLSHPAEANAKASHVEGHKTPVTATHIATLPIPMITAMDIRADGNAMAITTYRDLFVYERRQGERWEEAFRGVPKRIGLPKLRQIEAVCFDRAGDLWVTSERSPMALFKLNQIGM